MKTTRKLLARVRVWLCPHRERLWAREPGRVFTRCMECGHESPGWEIHHA